MDGGTNNHVGGQTTQQQQVGTPTRLSFHLWGEPGTLTEDDVVLQEDLARQFPMFVKEFSRLLEGPMGANTADILDVSHHM